MFDINRRHFIFKQSSGKIFNILHKESAGICLSTLSKKDVWYTPTVIMKNAIPEFYAYMDSSDGIHILCQDRNSSITYLYYDNSAWKSIPITTGRNAVHGLRNLWIGGFEKKLYMFYTIEYPGSSFLYYQAGSIPGNLSEPNVLDCIEVSGTAYRSVIDNSGNICIFYMQKTPFNKVLGSRVRNASTGIWSDFTPFQGEADRENLQVLSVNFDTDNNLHLLWNETSNTSCTLYYAVRNSGEAGWCKEAAITDSDQPCINSSIVLSDKLLAIYWIIGNNIYYRISSDSGSTWSEQATYSLLEGKHIYCMSYMTNVTDDQVSLSVLCLPGSFTDGYRLAFLNDLNNLNTAKVKSLIPANDTNDTSHESNIREPVNTWLYERYEQLATEIEKLNIRQSLLETEIAKLSSDFDAINISISSTIRVPETNATKPVQKLPVPQDVKLMPGSGFSFVTPEYLKSLKKQK